MNSEGAFWKDPPGYFEQLVYSAYLDAHRGMFTVRRHASVDILISLLMKCTGWRCRRGVTVITRAGVY